MIIAYWILAGLLAVAFLGIGLMKVVRPKQALAEAGMGWTRDTSAGAVKLVGILEVLGAIGLILPMLTGIAPILSPIAAVAIAVLLVCAVIVHVRREEPFIPVLVLILLPVVVAILGFLLVA